MISEFLPTGVNTNVRARMPTVVHTHVMVCCGDVGKCGVSAFLASTGVHAQIEIIQEATLRGDKKASGKREDNTADARTRSS